MLQIIHQEKEWVAINKPNGLLVHRSKIAADVQEFAVQQLRDQLGRKVFPVHRLDRKTSGVLLFGLNSSITAILQSKLQEPSCLKAYIAIVRGFFPDQCIVEKDLINDKGKQQAAKTTFICLQHSEIPIPFGKHKTSRYSLIKAVPHTGRMHQIRKHLNHLRHPIIGDRPHGCNKQNKLFKDRWNLTDMLLHCHTIKIKNPETNTPQTIEAPFPESFEKIAKELLINLNALQLDS